MFRGTRVFIGSLVSLVVLTAFTSSAQATVEVCHAHRAGQVYINHCSNHGYYARSLDLTLPLAAKGLAIVRQRLIHAGKLRNLPLVIEARTVPWQVTNSLSMHNNCALDTGDSADLAKTLGPCYVIVFDGRTRGRGTTFYSALRTLTVALLGLSTSHPQKTFKTLGPLKTRWAKTEKYLGPVAYQSPYGRSPDGRTQLVLTWRDGALSFQLRDARNRMLRYLPRLNGELAIRPVWSRDSGKIAYGSLKEVKAYTVATGRSVTLGTTARSGKTVTTGHEIAVAFNTAGDKVAVATDRNLFMDYDIYVMELRNGASKKVSTAESAPEWVKLSSRPWLRPTKKQRQRAQQQIDEFAKRTIR